MPRLGQVIRTGDEVTIPFSPDVAAKYEIAEPVLPGKILTWDRPTCSPGCGTPTP